MKYLPIIVLTYLVIISIISAIACVYDKWQAQRGGWRVSEAALFIFSLLGGAAVMLLTMKKIRHKTRHKRFMIGLPAIIITHLLLSLFLLHILDKL